MKRFLKKRWHSIPVGIVAVLMALILVAGSAFAAMSQTQTITQVITAVPVPSSVVVSNLAVTKPNLQVDTMDVAENLFVIATVTVVVGTGDAGDYLHLEVDDTTTTLYFMNSYGVFLTSTAANNPMGTDLTLSVNSAGAPIVPGPHESLQLTAEGTYVFDEVAGGMAGGTPGTANVKVDVYLSSTP